MNRKEASRVDTEFYIDYDDESDCWGVFGDVSGFCYALYASQEPAIEWMKKNLNR